MAASSPVLAAAWRPAASSCRNSPAWRSISFPLASVAARRCRSASTSARAEASAVASPPQLFTADWTLENYAEVWARSDYPRFFWNSVVISVGSTLLGLLVAVPAAWAMAFVPGKKTKDLLMWMLSTKMMPAVGVLIPMYLGFRNLGLLDTRTGLVAVLTLINLPIVVWMLYLSLIHI